MLRTRKEMSAIVVCQCGAMMGKQPTLWTWEYASVAKIPIC